MRDLFQRCDKNPLITRESIPWTVTAVYNPGATLFEGKTLLLVRIEDQEGYSDIYVATSEDGITGWEISGEPLIRRGEPTFGYETLGCEDPRITYVEEERVYYITYVAYSELGAAVGLARTTDFKSVERLCLLFSPNNKDTVLFPRRINKHWWVFHRQASGDMEHIWSAQSPDLYHWGMPHCVLPERKEPQWDNVKVGAGPPPLLTERGWLLIYHGVKRYGDNLVYRAGLALLEAERPHKVIKRLGGWCFEPEAAYETTGATPNIIFPSGLIVYDDELWMYYGAADRTVCLATAKFADVMKALE